MLALRILKVLLAFLALVRLLGLGDICWFELKNFFRRDPQDRSDYFILDGMQLLVLLYQVELKLVALALIRLLVPLLI